MEDQQSENISIDDQCDSPISISLLQICYFIALFDFAQSIYFLVRSTSLLVLNVCITEIDVYNVYLELSGPAGKSLLNDCLRGIDILDIDGNSAYCGPLEGMLAGQLICKLSIIESLLLSYSGVSD